MAEKYRQLPSSLLRLDDPYTAWCVDEAITMFKARVDAAVDAAGERAPKSNDHKMEEAVRQAELDKLIKYNPDAHKEESTPAQRKFADPAAMVRASR